MKYFAIIIVALCLIETSLGISWKTNSSLWKADGSEDRSVVNRMTLGRFAPRLKDNTPLKLISLLALSKEKSETEDKMARMKFGDVAYKVLCTLEAYVFNCLMSYEQLLHIILPVALPFSIVGLMLNTQFFHYWGYQRSHIVKSLIDQMNQVLLPFMLPIAVYGSIMEMAISSALIVFNPSRKEETKTLSLKKQSLIDIILRSISIPLVVICISSTVHMLLSLLTMSPIAIPLFLQHQSNTADWEKLKHMIVLLTEASLDYPIIANYPLRCIIVSIIFGVSFSSLNIASVLPPPPLF